MLLEAAAIIGQTAVQEATKSAYAEIKQKIADLFGRRGTDSLTALETEPGDPNARAQLCATLQSLSEPERRELAPLFGSLTSAFQNDPVARATAEKLADIRMEISAGNDVVIQRITGANATAIKAEAGNDVHLSDITMKGSNDLGN